jgi:hypothetical protein
VRGASAPYPLTRPGRLCVLLALAKLALLVPILALAACQRSRAVVTVVAEHASARAIERALSPLSQRATSHASRANRSDIYRLSCPASLELAVVATTSLRRRPDEPSAVQ